MVVVYGAKDILFLGCAFKIYLTYKTAFWREKGCSGAGFDSVSPLSCVYDACTSDGAPILLVFIAGRAALEWNDRSLAGAAFNGSPQHLTA